MRRNSVMSASLPYVAVRMLGCVTRTTTTAMRAVSSRLRVSTSACPACSNFVKL
ncbi:hypothetical protein [Selenomonas sp.]|uniref:hypothetical protein n=1 Tax=Selenomonas sp. TaxID=2053611 RepID=UPI003A0FE172